MACPESSNRESPDEGEKVWNCWVEKFRRDVLMEESMKIGFDQFDERKNVHAPIEQRVQEFEALMLRSVEQAATEVLNKYASYAVSCVHYLQNVVEMMRKKNFELERELSRSKTNALQLMMNMHQNKKLWEHPVESSTKRLLGAGSPEPQRRSSLKRKGDQVEEAEGQQQHRQSGRRTQVSCKGSYNRQKSNPASSVGEGQSVYGHFGVGYLTMNSYTPAMKLPNLEAHIPESSTDVEMKEAEVAEPGVNRTRTTPITHIRNEKVVVESFGEEAAGKEAQPIGKGLVPEVDGIASSVNELELKSFPRKSEEVDLMQRNVEELQAEDVGLQILKKMESKYSDEEKSSLTYDPVVHTGEDSLPTCEDDQSDANHADGDIGDVGASPESVTPPHHHETSSHVNGNGEGVQASPDSDGPSRQQETQEGLEKTTADELESSNSTSKQTTGSEDGSEECDNVHSTCGDGAVDNVETTAVPHFSCCNGGGESADTTAFQRELSTSTLVQPEQGKPNVDSESNSLEASAYKDGGGKGIMGLPGSMGSDDVENVESATFPQEVLKNNLVLAEMIKSSYDTGSNFPGNSDMGSQEKRRKRSMGRGEVTPTSGGESKMTSREDRRVVQGARQLFNIAMRR